MNNIYHVFYLLHLPPSPPSLFKISSFLREENTSDMKDATNDEQLCKDSFRLFMLMPGKLCRIVKKRDDHTLV